jgi:organic hydroperoxide reductase OsmC/OhrA
MSSHRYETRLNWSGSTGLGWEHYDVLWFLHLASKARIDVVRKLVHAAHEHCFIANSLNSAMSIEPSVERR